MQLSSHLVFNIQLQLWELERWNFSRLGGVGSFRHGARAGSESQSGFLIEEKNLKCKRDWGGFKATGWFGLFSVDVFQELRGKMRSENG